MAAASVAHDCTSICYTGFITFSLCFLGDKPDLGTMAIGICPAL